MVKQADDTGQRFFAVFTSIREISQSPILTIENFAPHPEYTYLYIEFSRVYEWIKKHRADIDYIAFDLLGQYFTPFDTDKFIEIIDDFQRNAMAYTGKNLVHDLRIATLDKHLPKSRKNKKG